MTESATSENQAGWQPQTFLKRPVAIEAFQWDGSIERATKIINWALANGGTIRLVTWTDDTWRLHVDTLEGVMKASWGDWIIKGVAGEFYPCKPDIFAATYDAATCTSSGGDSSE